ncbi:MAG: 2-oxoacid:ferredoxin oxidoreductase subunit beta [Desulfuromonadaceae bacterium]|nr:2-oxoacid:ferredoxin oxidoreductase subunit beta [Desulfuromonadaceae bacterium]
MVTMEDYTSNYENQWCPGCGNFGILPAMKMAFVAQKLAPHELLLVSGIGQAGKTPHFLECNFIHALHGRALAVASGAKLANHNLNVVVNSGDGDCYGEGGNHFIHAIRRNMDLTLLVHNNQIYGLTKGQASPTTDRNMLTSIQSHGVSNRPFHPLAVALSLGAGFVARGFAGQKEQLAELIQAAMNYKGFSLIDILQPCVTFNHLNTFAWYRERAVDITTLDHDVSDRQSAMQLALEWEERIPTGILYQHEEDDFTALNPWLQQGPMLQREYNANAINDYIAGLYRI